MIPCSSSTVNCSESQLHADNLSMERCARSDSWALPRYLHLSAFTGHGSTLNSREASGSWLGYGRLLRRPQPTQKKQNRWWQRHARVRGGTTWGSGNPHLHLVAGGGAEQGDVKIDVGGLLRRRRRPPCQLASATLVICSRSARHTIGHPSDLLNIRSWSCIDIAEPWQLAMALSHGNASQQRLLIHARAALAWQRWAWWQPEAARSA